MSKHQFIIGTGATARTLNFEGSKKQAEAAATKWQSGHPQYVGVQYVKTLNIRKPKIELKKMYGG